MYKLIHVPTGTELGTFRTTKEVFEWLDGTDWDKADCILHVYQLTETLRLG
jgi:hypothetical protein